MYIYIYTLYILYIYIKYMLLSIYITIKSPMISPAYSPPLPGCSMCIFRNAAIEKDGLQTYCPRGTWGNVMGPTLTNSRWVIDG